MKRETFFLKFVVFLLAIPILALCIFFVPRFEHVLAGSYPSYWIYIIQTAMYGSALVYFSALYQALKLLTYIDHNTAFSELSLQALKVIRNCAFTISCLYIIASPFLYFIADQEDAPGIIAFGLMIALASLTIGVFAAVLKKLLQNAIAIQSENELTI
ncbi:hypothetical protein D3C77_360930 [compost metagenome]